MDGLRDARPLILAGLAILGAVILVLIAFRLRELLAVLFLGGVVGVTLAPLADRLARYHVPRLLSILLVYAGVATALSLFAWFAAPTVADDISDVISEYDQLEQEYAEFAEERDLPPAEEVRTYLEQRLRDFGASAAREAFAVVGIVGYIVSAFVFAAFFALSRERAQSFIVSLFDWRQRDEADRVLSATGKRLRRYMLSELVAMSIIGVLTYIGLTIIGLPLAGVLAVLAFLFEILPIVGPWLAAVPALLVASGEGFSTMIWVGLLYLLIQQLESNLITPIVQRRGTHMPEIIVFTAILIGGALMGVLGALVALPLAVILHTLTVELIVPWRRRVLGKRRREVEQGVTAEDAAPGTEN